MVPPRPPCALFPAKLSLAASEIDFLAARAALQAAKRPRAGPLAVAGEGWRCDTSTRRDAPTRFDKIH